MEHTEAPQEAIDRMVRVINDGWLVTILSLGERTGLSTAVPARPTGLAAIAAAGGCDARYTEIWLWAMVAGGFVLAEEAPGEGSAATTTLFRLAPGAERVLTAAGGPDHWARIAEQITAFAVLEDQLVHAFRTGGGLPASVYEGRITEVLAAESTPIFERTVLGEVFPRFGFDTVASRGARIADLGCGTGDLALLLAQRFPGSSFVGVDQSEDAVASASERAADLMLGNVVFHLADLEDPYDLGILSERGLSDLDLVIAANVAHDLSDPTAFFGRVRTMLRPDGALYLHELSASTDMAINAANEHALGILAFSLYHCLPLAKRRPGIAPGGMYGTQRYVDALQAAGYGQVEVFHAPSDPTNDTVVARVRSELRD